MLNRFDNRVHRVTGFNNLFLTIIERRLVICVQFVVAVCKRLLHVWCVLSFSESTVSPEQRTDTVSGPASVWLLTYCSLNIRHPSNISTVHSESTRMWANAQRDGRPAERRWRPLLNAAKFSWRPLLDCHEVPLPILESRWNWL